jgi:ribosomal protein S8
MIENLKEVRRKLLRYFKLRPIHTVVKLLKKHNYLMMDNVLEVFGYTGAYHTQDYIKNVKQLDIWEIAKDCEAALKKNLPNANVRITNSYEEIKKTPKKFDTIIVDNHQGLFGDDKCEHFEIIEDCFSKLSDKSVLIMNIIPDLQTSPYITRVEERTKHIERRKSFYQHDTGVAISVAHFEKIYGKLANKNGYQIAHIFFVKRNELMTYLVLCLKK